MSLKDKAMLVSLNVTKPQMQKKDGAATTEVAHDKHADATAVAVVKKLYPKHLLQPIVMVEGAGRRYIESVTQTWSRGTYLLPCVLFMDFQQSMGTFKLQFEQAVTVFLNNYATVMAQAQMQQGTMFDAGSYPDMATLKADFSFGVRYYPLADVPSLVLDLEDKVLTELRDEITAQTTASLAMGQKDLYARLAAEVRRIHIQCGNEKGKIYDSLTGNLADLLRILPALNLNDDPEFTALCKEASVLVVAPEALRTVPEVRTTVANNAKDILARMEAYL